MEKPYSDRLTINQFHNGVEFIVKAKKSPSFIASLVIFIFVALVAMVGLYYLNSVKGADQQTHRLAIFRVSVLVLVMLPSLYKWWWMVAGREIITFSDGVITIVKKGSLAKTRNYDLADATDFRLVVEEGLEDRRNVPLAYSMGVAMQGTVKFDYGIETIQFGDLLNLMEGEEIVKTLRIKRIIK